MGYIAAKDISQWQGAWQDTGEPIVMIKMSGGDAGLYMDTQAAKNYDSAIKAGKAVGGYHFAGGTDPVAEANFFMRAMSPLAENDVYCLDWEVHNADPVGWCHTFMNTVHDKIGVWPLLYINLSTLNSYDWSTVLANCGLWLADWAVSPDAQAPTNHVYVMQQYADGPGYDRDAWFGTIEEFKKYGYHAPIPAPAPAPAPTPEPTPAPIPVEPVPAPPENPPVITVVTPPATNTVSYPIPAPAPQTKKQTFWQRFIAFLERLFNARRPS